MDRIKPIIGLETHLKLKTLSKLFSCAVASASGAFNQHVCPITLGLPGTLPTVNHEAIRQAVLFGMAIDATIAPMVCFDRKHYTYPDLPKGFQITQHHVPLLKDGRIAYYINHQWHEAIINTAHLEEDAGCLHHEDHRIGIDYNRAGVALLEVVTPPQFSEVSHVIGYLKALHTLVQYLSICDGKMQDGSFRCDVNISVTVHETVGTRVEIKNVNSFKHIEHAILYEIDRHVTCFKKNEKIISETRLYDEHAKKTISMRHKEASSDYRFYPEVDLPPIILEPCWLDIVRDTLIELPQTAHKRLQTHYGLSAYDASVIIATRTTLLLFDDVSKQTALSPKLIANWIINIWLAYDHPPTTTDTFIQLLNYVENGTLMQHEAKNILETLATQDHQTLDTIMANRQPVISDSMLQQLCSDLLLEYTQQVADYRSGKIKVLPFLVGKAIQKIQGVHPHVIRAMLETHLNTDKTIK
jgi:aspartyl-tRNA(Asn)/glutamyl-tRNA(Gln) amidotransferase subunit B